MKEEDALSIIAHEIAHAYLGHDVDSNTLLEDCQNIAVLHNLPNGESTIDLCEIQACALTKRWGFSGIGTDVNHCAKFASRA